MVEDDGETPTDSNGWGIDPVGLNELWRKAKPLVADWRGDGRNEKVDDGAGRLGRDVKVASFLSLTVGLSTSWFGLCIADSAVFTLQV